MARLRPLAKPTARRPGRTRLSSIVCSMAVAVVSFYGGMLVGMHNSVAEQRPKQKQQQQPNDFTRTPEFEQEVKARVEAIVRKQNELKEESSHVKNDSQLRFGEGTAHFALGAARVTKQDFVESFDSGLPADLDNDPAASEVLIFYNGKKSLPEIRQDETMTGSDVPPKLTALDATQNCHILNVVSTMNHDQQCVALVPQYESFHVQRWMRIKAGKGGVADEFPLVPVGRGQGANGANRFVPPEPKHVQAHWSQLQTFLNSHQSTLNNLKPLLKQVAVKNSVVVMVCNRGQADLLVNFACSNKAKGLSVSNVLVFCTDEETRSIATQLGMVAYYDEKNFANYSSKAAGRYGDAIFQQMMFAKVVVVQLVNWLGYNLLFQDVDVLWYMNPLDFFESQLQEFDVLFQDDGARSLRYAPYSANSGFYFVRHNGKTRHLFTRLIFEGDTIFQHHSHQQALSTLLVEHASLYGLRVKTLDGYDFPCGFHFHRRSDFMRNVMSGTTVPWIFHMSWTESKIHKLMFLKQMGQWYVDGDGKQEELGPNSCLAEPIVSCHFSDKPSVIPCKDSPTIEKKGKPFWT